MAAMNCLQNKTLRGLLQGQLISLLIAGTGIFASILSSESANFPTMMNFLNYALLSSILLRRTTFGKYLLGKLYGDRYERSTDEGSSKGTVEACDDRSTRRDECTPRKLLFWYISGAILDVEANFLVTEAYNYTSITSIMLLDCFTIPCAMVLSYFFLGCRYSKMHYLGVVLCLLGLSCIVMTDALFAPDRQGTSTLLGDCMCLLGSGLYACSNVLEEYMVKYRDRWDYIGGKNVCVRAFQ
jgi:solute carrier family 35 protein F1/2